LIGKTFTHFQRNPKHTSEECERHYTGSHVPMVRNSMLANPARLSYYVGRVVREFDLNGGWTHPVTLWRYVWCHMTVDQKAGAGVDGTNHEPVARAAMSRDGAVSFSDLKRTVVEEETLLDRMLPGLAGSYHIFDYVRRADESADSARERLAGIMREANERLQGNLGARLLRINWVTNEGDWQPDAGLTGKLRDSSLLVAFVEFMFDDAYWSNMLFSQKDFAFRLLDKDFALARGCDIEVHCVFDRR